ncbi:hypothetical protein [Micromonospora sagamiensis]|uniref:Uncharacterized protein n=1 Tax=Micromonospora sagamiensis TaxID=47875 RepID=A0A562WB00_9ACTN|nr:hypothetical protein [Micromonospora sagamiensis]TWJ27295.1 hypothetical protein JD81_00782 [Micromonospora sagamiensis]
MVKNVQRVALALALAAVTPYVVLKLLWLAGSHVGMRPGTGTGDMHTTRMVVGNVVTLGLQALAVALAFALASTRGRRVPPWLILLIAGGATGLLAPIAVGLPLGTLIQTAVDGTVSSGNEGNLEGWVFALVYGGFGILALALAALLVMHVIERWGWLLLDAPRPPRQWWARLAGVAVLPFGLAMCYWGLAGPGEHGPAGMDAVAQRAVLLATGLLTLIGVTAPHLAGRGPFSPAVRWALTWTGCATAALQGPAQLLLANAGRPAVLVVALGLLATPAACVYGFAGLHQHLSTPARVVDQEVRVTSTMTRTS